MENLNQLISQYSQSKDKEKEVKAELNKIGTQLKELLSANDIQEYEFGGLKISYKPSEKSTVNEDKLINTIKKLARATKDKDIKVKIRAAVIKVEAIDEHHLETLIYDGTVTPEDIAECYESKTTWTLRLGKASKK